MELLPFVPFVPDRIGREGGRSLSRRPFRAVAISRSKGIGCPNSLQWVTGFRIQRNQLALGGFNASRKVRCPAASKSEYVRLPAFARAMIAPAMRLRMSFVSLQEGMRFADAIQRRRHVR